MNKDQFHILIILLNFVKYQRILEILNELQNNRLIKKKKSISKKIYVGFQSNLKIFKKDGVLQKLMKIKTLQNIELDL